MCIGWGGGVGGENTLPLFLLFVSNGFLMGGRKGNELVRRSLYGGERKKIEFEWSGLFFSSSKGEIEKRKG